MPTGLLVGIGVIFGKGEIKLQLIVAQKITPSARHNVTGRMTNIRRILLFMSFHLAARGKLRVIQPQTF